MLSKRTKRNFVSAALVGALILGGTVATTASANAAGKQGTTCTKLKAKSGVYTCSTNPLAPTSTKLIWITSSCSAANTDYLSNVANLAAYTKNASNATSQSQSVLASYQNALTVAQASLNETFNTAQYTIDYVPNTTTPSVQVTGYQAALAAYQAKLAADQTGLAAAQAALAKDKVGSPQAATDQADINDYTNGIKYRQETITQLTNRLTRIQNQVTSDQNEITTWTATVSNSIAQQKQLTAQLQAAVTTSKSTRAAACKTGL